MDAATINYERTFQMWTYSIGHSQLLLRSVKAEGFPTRIDVLFKNVAAIHLPTLIEGLNVRVGPESDQSKLNISVHDSRLAERKVFVVHGQNFVGYVVAGVMVVHEDQGEYNEPSYFPLTSGS